MKSIIKAWHFVGADPRILATVPPHGRRLTRSQNYAGADMTTTQRRALASALLANLKAAKAKLESPSGDGYER